MRSCIEADRRGALAKTGFGVAIGNSTMIEVRLSVAESRREKLVVGEHFESAAFVVGDMAGVNIFSCSFE